MVCPASYSVLNRSNSTNPTHFSSTGTDSTRLLLRPWFWDQADLMISLRKSKTSWRELLCSGVWRLWGKCTKIRQLVTVLQAVQPCWCHLLKSCMRSHSHYWVCSCGISTHLNLPALFLHCRVLLQVLILLHLEQWSSLMNPATAAVPVAQVGLAQSNPLFTEASTFKRASFAAESSVSRSGSATSSVWDKVSWRWLHAQLIG